MSLLQYGDAYTSHEHVGQHRAAFISRMFIHTSYVGETTHALSPVIKKHPSRVNEVLRIWHVHIVALIGEQAPIWMAPIQRETQRIEHCPLSHQDLLLESLHLGLQGHNGR